MKCTLCGYEFDKNESVSSCAGCLMSKGCGMMRCPNCGYEVPTEPKSLSILRNWRNKNGSE